MLVRITTSGGDDLFSLRNWLGGERELDGLVTVGHSAIQPGQMGGLPEFLEVAVGSGGAVTVLVRTIGTWMRSRQVDVEIEQVAADGSSRRLKIHGPHDPSDVIAKFLADGD